MQIPSSVGDLWRHRELLWQFTVRSVEVRHKGSHLGLIWSFLNPLLNLGLYVFIFGYVFGGKFGVLPNETRMDFALGVLIGLVTEIARKLLKNNRRYKKFAQGSRTGFATDFMVDSVFLSSPYASSFGGFVELNTLYWWAGGGTLASLYDTALAKLNSRRPKPAEGELPADMSTMSLVGGGLIAGDSLAALSVGIYGLLTTVLK